MESTEKMNAFKKAYADIILNTAKEAATRVLVSERNALRFQRELATTKDDALGLLLRLKKIMDSKIAEAERESLSQRRRIQELEVQVSKAEDTVKELRIELKRAHDELREIKCNLVEPLDEQTLRGNATFHEDACQENKLSTDPIVCMEISRPGHISTSSDEDKTLNHRYADDLGCFMIENTRQKGPINDLPVDTYYDTNPHLASMIMRSKEPELLRNGCTQRIHAFEQSLLMGKSPFPGETDDQQSPVNNELIFKEDKSAEQTRTEASPKVGDMVTGADIPSGLKEIAYHYSSSCDKSEVLHTEASSEVGNMMTQAEILSELTETAHDDSSYEKGKVVKFFRRFSSRKQRARCKNNKPMNSETLPNPVLAAHEPHKLTCSKNSSCSPDSMTEYGEKFSAGIREEAQIDLNPHISPVTAKCTKIARDFEQIHSNVSSEDANPETMVSLEPGLGHMCYPEKDSELITADCIENAAENMSIEEPLLTRQVDIVGDTSGVSICKENLGPIDVRLINSDSKDERMCLAGGAPVQTVNDRVLKYTFQRKRKRGSLSSLNENISLEKNTSKKTGNKQISFPEPMESSRDNRRMVLVARQLISLSERRWS